MHSLGAAQLLSEGAAQRLMSGAKSNVMLEIEAMKFSSGKEVKVEA